MRPKPPKPTTERTASFGWPTKITEAEQGRWMNTYQPPSSTIEPILRTVQPPWVFMANLDVTDGESMQRVAQYFYYKLHHDSNEDLVTMWGLDEVEAREVQRMYVESQESKLLQDMLKWFGAFHDQAERRLIKNAETLSRAVTVHVREPKQYTVGYEHAKILWEKVLKGVDPYAEKKKKKVSTPRQPKKTTPTVAKPKTVKKTGGAKVATCRIIVEESDEDEATTYFDGDIYEETEEYDDVDEDSEEESEYGADFGADGMNSDAMDIDFIPFPSSPPPTNNRKRRLEVEGSSGSSSEELMLPPPSLTPARGRRRSLVLPPTMSRPAKSLPAKSIPAKGKGRGKTLIPSPPPKKRKKTRKRKTSDTSSTSSDMPYRNVFEEDVLPKTLRMTRAGREY